MTERPWRVRELVGLAFAALVLALPVGSLVRLQAAKHWSVATQSGAGASAILLVWILIALFGLISARSQ